MNSPDKDTTADPESRGLKERLAESDLSKMEAVILLLIGLGAGWFAVSENYGLLMQPKFRWLTLSGALVVFAMGTTSLGHVRKTGVAGSVAFLLLFSLVLAGRPFSESSASAVTTALRLPDAESVEDPDFPMRDIRDLLTAIEEKNPRLKEWVFSALGTVKHLPGDDGNAQVALMRTYMVCCAADAVGLGLRVEGDDIGAYKDSDWVVVRGRLARSADPVKVAPFRLGTATFAVVSEDYVIDPVAVVPLSATLPSLTDQLAAQSTARFTEALRASGLLSKLEEKGPFTVLAPINEALDGSDLDDPDGLLRSKQKSHLKSWVSGHIVPGRYLERDLYGEKVLQTIHDQDLHVRVENGRLLFGDSRILLSNIEARNGVIHIIYPALEKIP